MGAYTIFDRIRDFRIRHFIGDIGWRIFIWSTKLTEEQYFQLIYEGIKAEKGCTE